MVRIANEEKTKGRFTGVSDLKQLLNNERKKREEGLKLSSVFLMAFAIRGILLWPMNI